MFQSGGYFKNFVCPHARTDGCFRPYCPYGGHSTGDIGDIAVVTNSISTSPLNEASTIQQLNEGANNANPASDEPVPSYTTVPTDHFQGYHGYFATSSSPPPPVPKRPLLPTPAAIVRPSQHARLRPPRQPQRNNVAPRKRAPPPQTSQQQRGSNLNELARDLAAINNEIERLQHKLTKSSEQDVGDGDSTANTDEDGATDEIATYDPEDPIKRTRYSESQGLDSASSANNGTDSSSDELYRPKAASTSASKLSPYKPTPIEKLQKQEQPKNKLLKDNWKPSSDIGIKQPKSVMSNKKLAEKATSSKSAALLEKKKNSVAATAVSDLFGDDSDAESFTERPRSVSKNAVGTKKRKEDPEDMASIIEDFIAPTATATQKTKMAPAAKREFATSSDDGIEKKKKRVAQLSSSSLEAAKELRKAGGERAKGNLMTPREQLESRFAHLKKAEEELQARQRELQDELEKKQTLEPPQKQAVDRNRNITSSALKQPAVAEIATHPKGEKRTARIPKQSEPAKSLTTPQRPTIAIEIGAKVPTNIRQQYLNLIIDEFLKFLPEHDAYQKASEEERAVYAKAASKAGYLNAVVNAIKRIRDREGASTSVSETQQPKKGTGATISHSSVIGGKKAKTTTYTLGRSGGGSAASNANRRSTSSFSNEEFYESLSSFVMTIEQQASNGYPRPDPDRPGFAVYMKEEIKKAYVDDDEVRRICIRCGTRYQLSPEGDYLGRDECLFHWGRAWKKRISGMVESRYTCCQGDLNSAGCSVSQYHVSDRMPKSALGGYVYTNGWSSGNKRFEAKVYALDCEMVYTTSGNELARVTVVDDRCQVVYERCVRPTNTILDYNSRFSGLTEELLSKDDVVVTLDDVHVDLSKLFTPETILIGHSLESDFRALKLIHDKVVDTSIVFPHRLGAPYKRALKTLAVEFLKRIIQDDVDGHDSKEDAVTCMDLMKWRIKQDGGRAR